MAVPGARHRGCGRHGTLPALQGATSWHSPPHALLMRWRGVLCEGGAGSPPPQEFRRCHWQNTRAAARGRGSRVATLSLPRPVPLGTPVCGRAVFVWLALSASHCRAPLVIGAEKSALGEGRCLRPQEWVPPPHFWGSEWSGGGPLGRAPPCSMAPSKGAMATSARAICSSTYTAPATQKRRIAVRIAQEPLCRTFGYNRQQQTPVHHRASP